MHTARAVVDRRTRTRHAPLDDLPGPASASARLAGRPGSSSPNNTVISKTKRIAVDPRVELRVCDQGRE